MARVIAGTIRSYNISGLELDPAQDSEPKFNPSGRHQEVKVSGNEKLYSTSNPHSSFFSNDFAVDEDTFKKLHDLQTSGRELVETITFASGKVASGTVSISNTEALQNANGVCTLETRGNTNYI